MSDRSIRITLVRHGESASNRAMKWQGQGNSPLSTLGEAQARAVAARLRDRHFDRIVASDLERADATARALARPFASDPGFREFDIGAWEGLTREQVQARFPTELARLDAGEDVAIGGGESYVRFCERVDESLAALRAQMREGEHALVVCHGGVIGALVSGALGLRSQRSLSIARVFNTSITELSFDASGGTTVDVFNDSLHLAELSPFPHPPEMQQALALICDMVPHPAYGTFAAHYDFELGGAWFQRDDEERRFAALFDDVRARHPDGRVALSASGERVHAWARQTVWRDGNVTGSLSAPRPGALCHFGTIDGRLALLDYGVSV